MAEGVGRVNIYLDYESAIRVLCETKERLAETTEKLESLKARHIELTGQHEELRTRYFELKQSNSQGLWDYLVKKSSDFEEIKNVDTNLIETQNRVGNYNLGEVLGNGQFSTVRALLVNKGPSTSVRVGRRGRMKQLDKLLAVKIIKKENVSSVDGILSYENEIRTLKEVSAHRNIVDFIQVLHGPANLYIVMEGFKHDLFNFMEQYKVKVDTNITGLILKEVLSGVAHLAQHYMIHRDIKPENILVHVATNDIVVKLCDFGLCKKLDPQVTTIYRDFAGSPGFFAPELITNTTVDPYKTDIFSVGSTALEMLTSVEFFTKKWMQSYHSLKDPVEKGNFYFHIRSALLTAQDEMSMKFSGGADACVRDFVCCILHMQPSLRPAVTDLLRTKWMTKVDKARACDTLLDRDALYARQRRFSYIPPRRQTQGELDAEFTRKTLLPKGVKIPLSKQAGLPSIPATHTAQSPQVDLPRSRRRSSTFQAVQQLQHQNRRTSNAKVKDNGLGSLALDDQERQRVAQSRRASFLMVESEQATRAEGSQKGEGGYCDPSNVPFDGGRTPGMLGALVQALQEKQKGEEEVHATSSNVRVNADWGQFADFDDGKCTAPTPRSEGDPLPLLIRQSNVLEQGHTEPDSSTSTVSALVMPEKEDKGLQFPLDPENALSVNEGDVTDAMPEKEKNSGLQPLTELVIPEEEDDGLQFPMDLENALSVNEGDVTDGEYSSSDSSASASRKPSNASIVDST